jgi:hypothetical protein
LFINERVGSRQRCFVYIRFVLLLRLMLNFVVRRSGACDGDGEWACAALILTHLNDE